MASKPKQAILLTALLVVLGGVMAWQFWPTTQVLPPAGHPPRLATRGSGTGATMSGDIPPPHVRLSRLKEAGPEPNDGRRNPFTLRAEAAEPVTPAPGEGQGRSAPGPEARASGGAAPPPAIPLKFIGTLTGAAPTGRIAVLSDGKFVYYGREGDIIEGRYRLVKIGEESLNIEYLDGRGGQTLRMSGS